MSEIISKVVKEALTVTLLVGIMMVAVDLLNVLTKQRLRAFFATASKKREYIIASFIGSIPGCFGGFTNVSLYIHGLISFGALAGSMIAVSGDEAFVMLAMFPQDALLLFISLFVLGALAGWIIDVVVNRFGVKTCSDCSEMVVHQQERTTGHYLKEHVWRHIICGHLFKTLIWTLGALFIIEISTHYFDIQGFTSDYKLILFFAGGFMGLIPESGPHLLFVSLYAQGLIPFSILLTSSMVQDGHGMLPMFSYSFKDSMKIKGLNLLFGLIVGGVLLAMGL